MILSVELTEGRVVCWVLALGICPVHAYGGGLVFLRLDWHGLGVP